MKAFAYCRFSSRGQREESIEAQIREIEKYASDNNTQIMQIYVDRAESATTDNRTNFQKMINLLVDTKNSIGINYIIVHKLDRIFRDRYDSAVYKRKLKLLGIKIVSVLERIDDSPESIILESSIEAFAEYYSRNLAREVMKGLKENAYKAKFNGGILPLGYDTDSDNNYVINEHEAFIVRFIFSEYLKGTGYRTICKILKEKGYKTRSNKNFTHTSIYSILKNEKYTGKYVFNKTHNLKTEQGKKIFRKNNDDVIITIDNAIPIIIDKKTFSEVEIMLEKNKKIFRSFNTVENIYLLAGKLYCGKCGSLLTGSTRKGGANKNSIYSSYVCGDKKKGNCTLKEIKKDEIENAVIELLETKLFNKDAIDKLLKNIEKELEKFKSEYKSEITVFEKELKDTEKQIANIVEAVANGFYNPAMKDKMSELEDKKNNLVVMIAEEKIKLTAARDTDKIKEDLQAVKSLKTLEPKKQKEIIQKYVKKITINDDNYEVLTNINVATVSNVGFPLYYTVATTIIRNKK